MRLFQGYFTYSEPLKKNYFSSCSSRWRAVCVRQPTGALKSQDRTLAQWVN